jgi:hypothetical protein
MERLKRLGAYAKAHWKELLALTLAAIPAAFILFHKGARQTAQQAISYPAALFGGGGAGSDTTSSTSTTSSDNNTGAAKPLPCPPGYHWVPPTGPKPGSGAKFASIAGHCAPDQATKDKQFSFGGLHPAARSPKIPSKTIASHVPAHAPAPTKKVVPPAPTFREPSAIEVKKGGPKYL